MFGYVFAYGSLCWNPQFVFVERVPAVLEGWHLSWNVRSTFYRGCRERPGLVAGLKRGGECHGLLHRIRAEDFAGVLEALDRREFKEAGYERQTVLVDWRGDRVEAAVYTSDRMEEPCQREFADAYSSAKGCAGTTRDYVDRVTHLIEVLKNGAGAGNLGLPSTDASGREDRPAAPEVGQ